MPFGSVSAWVGNVRDRTVTAPAARAPPFFATLGRVTRQPTRPGRVSRSTPISAVQWPSLGNTGTA
jgi:hypothetical protein